MSLRASSNLKELLDARGLSIRKFSDMTGLPYETLRRLYNDDTKQYQRNTIGRICEVLDVDINELLTLIDDDEAE